MQRFTNLAAVLAIPSPWEQRTEALQTLTVVGSHRRRVRSLIWGVAESRYE
ncbi:hypothetical protein H6F92_06710 [Microcystis wesenbergii FACHB-1317]|uniref:hypothetical protein n=1 Tax=Microcystis TaxID=1125 RepID=UPI0016814A1B|nr:MULTISPECIES: hypothetical protein [Microcystis]MBD2288524.1 hypothetical protein [Microcystis wesenbergii FACHB-1317]UZO76252.1 hypothetical protein M8120_26865 [Microcystis aeruginosa str. Chao 1910]